MAIEQMISVVGEVYAIRERETAGGHSVRTVVIKAPFTAFTSGEIKHDYLSLDYWDASRPDVKIGQTVRCAFRVAGRLRDDNTTWTDLKGVSCVAAN